MPRQRQPHSVLERDLSPEQLDAGKRASDFINGCITFHGFHNIQHQCVAIRLADGGTDGVLYDTRPDAIRHQLHEQQCAYVFFRGLGPAGAQPLEMAIYLEFQRRAYAGGLRLIDPDNPNGGPELLITAGQYDSLRSELARRNRGRLHA